MKYLILVITLYGGCCFGQDSIPYSWVIGKNDDTELIVSWTAPTYAQVTANNLVLLYDEYAADCWQDSLVTWYRVNVGFPEWPSTIPCIEGDSVWWSTGPCKRRVERRSTSLEGFIAWVRNY